MSGSQEKKESRVLQFIKSCTKGENVKNFIFIYENILLLYKDMTQNIENRWRCSLLGGFIHMKVYGKSQKQGLPLKTTAKVWGQ